MRDMSKGSFLGHILGVSFPVAVALLAQTLYVLVDLYFVSRLGSHAVAGVNAGGIVYFFVMGLTQIISVGTVSLMSRSIGAKNWANTSATFSQSTLLSLILAMFLLTAGYLFASDLMQLLGADSQVRSAGITYLQYLLPGLALQLPVACLSATFRAAGNTWPMMIVQILTVVCNIILAPILISGWLTQYPLGVAGAGLASSLSITFGLIVLVKTQRSRLT